MGEYSEGNFTLEHHRGDLVEVEPGAFAPRFARVIGTPSANDLPIVRALAMASEDEIRIGWLTLVSREDSMTGSVLDEISFREISEQIRSCVVEFGTMWHQLRRQLANKLESDDLDSLDQFDPFTLAVSHEEEARISRAIASAARARRNNRIDQKLLRRVTRTFEASPLGGIEAVMRSEGVSYSTAARYVQRAREWKLLPPKG